MATFKEVILNLTDQREIQKQIRRGIFDGLFDLDVVGAVRTPGVKKKYQGRQGAREVKKFEQEVDEHDKLTPAGATAYRAVAARCNYLSQDRPDISFAAKELCRDFAVPSRASMDKLKRMAKYLACVPRLVYCFPWQERPQHMVGFGDTDFAGCKVTRRSTSGGAIMYGQHCLRHWSSTQPTISLSSGEAELTGICKTASQCIGLKSIATDLGLQRTILVKTDATAAIGMSRRLGIGKVRHLDTSLLWIQQKVRSGECPLEKVLGAENPADIMTKHVLGPTLREHLPRLGLRIESGRAVSAPALVSSES